MKAKLLLTALMITLVTLSVSNSANAHPWRYRGGWYRPHASVLVPPIPVPVPRIVVSPGYYGSGYCAPAYEGSYYNGYYGNRYRDRAYYGRGECREPRYRGYAYDNGYHNGYRNYGPRNSYHYRR
ncbi:MAG: hypothetical protein JSS82_15220 [Bacteroidetes bacterium]|nr:hypothetical protein [Bacteroidota bacterium]